MTKPPEIPEKLYQNIPIPEAPIESSALDEDNFATVLLIQVSRLYDVGMALLAVVDQTKAKDMAELHAKGVIVTPPPALIEGEE